MKGWILKIIPVVLCAGALTCAPLNVQATNSGSSDDWQYSASIYLWGAGVHGETASGDDFDIDFDTLLDNLDMAFMGSFEVRNSRWSLLTDVIYMDLQDEGDASVFVPVTPFATINVKVDADAELKAWIVNLVGGYNVWKTGQATVDVLAGGRYFNLALDLDLRANAGRESASADLSPSVDVWDAVIGVKGYVDVDRHWYLPYYFDIGAGQSEFTWQALVGLGYRYGWGDVSVTYRHIDWKFNSDSPVDNAYLSGPLLAATFNF